VMAPYWALAGLLERYAALRRRRAEGGDLPRAKPSLVERFPLAAYLPQPRAAGR
jgi:hypothetical protein